MAGFNSYLTIHEYVRAVTGQEVASLYGNLFKLSGAGVVQGGTSLPVVPNTTVNLSVNDPITLFDGSSSEVVYVSNATASGASSIPVSATAFAHASGTSGCSDGRLGSLASAIVDGSAEVERICRQPLLQATYTNETFSLLTSRAMITNQGELLIRPRQSPIQSVSGITVLWSVGNSISIDTSNVILSATGKLVKVSPVKAVGAGNTLTILQTFNNQMRGDIQITYVSGFAYSALPEVIRRASILLVSDILADRVNATGAAEYQMDKFKQTAYLRGDLSGESALVKRARRWLQQYIQESI